MLPMKHDLPHARTRHPLSAYRQHLVLVTSLAGLSYGLTEQSVLALPTLQAPPRPILSHRNTGDGERLMILDAAQEGQEAWRP